MSHLLIDEPPLQVLPSLASEIGLNEAIFLQQLHYWLRKTRHNYDGFLWVYNTYEGWQEQFPFWSVPTIRRIVANLRKLDLIVTTDAYNQRGFDNTLWYTIQYDALSAISDRRSDQNDHMVRSERSEDARNLIRPIPETTSETTIEGWDHIWHSVLDALRTQLPANTFKSFIAPARLTHIDGDTATIAIPNAKAKDWIENRLARQLKQLLSIESKIKVTEIRVEIDQ